MPNRNPFFLIREFAHCVALLWRDKLGQISLATTTLFWGAGATLQFIVHRLGGEGAGLNLSQASMLQGVVAVGIAVGAVHRREATSRCAARSRCCRSASTMGLIVISMMLRARSMPRRRCVLMIAIGACAGFFVVPMNALLQHRGHVLMGAGHSIAVQNFNENIGILAMVGLYALMVRAGLDDQDGDRDVRPVRRPATMVLVMLRHRRNQARGDLAAPHRRRRARHGASGRARREH